MFALCCMRDTVHIKPHLFHLDVHHVIEEQLNKKFANKVLHGIGLCISLYDILSISDSYVLPGDGSSYTLVEFRYIVFRPHEGEVLYGRLRGCNQEGISEFFDEIFIPRELLQHPSRFDYDEQLWVWEYLTESGMHDLYMDATKEIRLRVVEHVFADCAPTTPETFKTDGVENESHSYRSPYTVVGTINHPGLGLVSWWTN